MTAIGDWKTDNQGRRYPTNDPIRMANDGNAIERRYDISCDHKNDKSAASVNAASMENAAPIKP
jgi:hypothetical protein